jgi:hypothetical protein
LGLELSNVQFPEKITDEKLAEIREYFMNMSGYTRLVGRSVPFSFLEVMMPLIYYYGLYDMVEFLKSNINSDMITKEYQDTLDELKVEIGYGDYIGYPENETTIKYFTVANDGKIFSDNAHTIGGYKGFYRTIICVPTDLDEFNGI